MGHSDRPPALALGGERLSPALRGGRSVVAHSQSLDRERQRRVAGGDEPYSDSFAWSHRRLEPVAGTPPARSEGIALCVLRLASLPDAGGNRLVELSRILRRR